MAKMNASQAQLERVRAHDERLFTESLEVERDLAALARVFARDSADRTGDRSDGRAGAGGEREAEHGSHDERRAERYAAATAST